MTNRVAHGLGGTGGSKHFCDLPVGQCFAPGNPGKDFPYPLTEEAALGFYWDVIEGRGDAGEITVQPLCGQVKYRQVRIADRARVMFGKVFLSFNPESCE